MTVAEKLQRKELEKLYGKASNGKIKVVYYSVEELEDGTVDIVNEHGYLDGKKQIDRRNIKVGKNIGKSNETTPWEQACSEVEAEWKKKLDSNYTTNESGVPDSSEQSLLPMLAHDFNKRKHNIKYPCLVQPKLDGVRCMARSDDGNARFTSRKDKPYDTLSHLSHTSAFYLNYTPDGAPLDGEVYKHGLSLQEINRRVKKHRPGETEELEYWVYDVAHTDMGNKERLDALQKIYDDFDRNPDWKVILVETFVANSEEEVKHYHDMFVKNGFEGVIVRNMDGKYVFDKRSADLQKYKEFQDDEFEIIGATTGGGREEGAIIFQCKVPNPVEGGAKEFEVRPRGSIEQRRVWMREFNEDAANFIGKQLTVRYFNYSEDNIPIFPVGITIRDYE